MLEPLTKGFSWQIWCYCRSGGALPAFCLPYLQPTCSSLSGKRYEECSDVALFSEIILCRSQEANFLGKAFCREEELQLTTFKGLILIYLFLLSFWDLKHFRASNVCVGLFFFFSPRGFYVILWEWWGYWNTLKAALSHHFGACFNTCLCLRWHQCPILFHCLPLESLLKCH